MANWSLIGSLFLPNFGGWASTITLVGQIERPDGKAWFQTLRKPPCPTPSRLAGHVIYTSMGYASYLALKECGGFTEKAVVPLSLYGGQLMLNWTWAPVFFGCHKLGLAVIHMAALDVAATACAISFYAINKKTAYFMVPYLCCLAFGTYMNFRIWQMNKEGRKDHD